RTRRRIDTAPCSLGRWKSTGYAGTRIAVRGFGGDRRRFYPRPQAGLARESCQSCSLLASDHYADCGKAIILSARNAALTDLHRIPEHRISASWNNAYSNEQHISRSRRLSHGDVERSECASRTDVTTVMRECNNVSRVFWSVLVFWTFARLIYG